MLVARGVPAGAACLALVLSACSAPVAGSPTGQPVLPRSRAPAASPTTTETPAPSTAGDVPFAPLLDGLYAGEGQDTTYYIRFFADRTVCYAGVVPTATADAVRRWLRPDAKAENCRGRYDGTGAFTFHAVAGDIDLTVRDFRGEVFDLHSVSHINGTTATRRMRFDAD